MSDRAQSNGPCDWCDRPATRSYADGASDVVVCEQCFTAAQSNGDGKRHAVVSGNTVRRVKEDGSYDRMTVHLTSISARRAAELYVRTGEVKGMRP